MPEKLKIGDHVTIKIPPMPEGVGPVTLNCGFPDICGCYVVGIEDEKLVIDLCTPHFIAFQHDKLGISMPILPTDFGDTGIIPCLLRRLIPLKKGEDGLFEMNAIIRVLQIN